MCLVLSIIISKFPHNLLLKTLVFTFALFFFVRYWQAISLTSFENYLLVIGFGVITTKRIQEREFVLEYPGKLISAENGRYRKENYPAHYGSFLFFYNEYW